MKAIQPHPHRVALPSAHPRPRAPPRPSSHPSPAALSPARSAARRLPAQPAALQPRVMPAERSTAPLQPPRPPRTALTPLRGSHVPQCARLSSAAALAESAKQPRKALPFSATSSCLGTESSSRVPAQPRSALHGITRAIPTNSCRRGARRASAAAPRAPPVPSWCFPLQYVGFFLMGWLEKDTRSAAECSDKSDIPKGPREGEKWGGKSSGITRTNGKSCSKKKNPLGQDRGRGTGWERTPQPGWQRAEGALSCTGQRLPCIQRSTAEQRRASAPPFCRRGALSTGGTRSCCSASRGGPRKWPKGRNSSTVGMG